MTDFLSMHPWRPAAGVRASGPDAFDFLQGQFTNDLRELDRHPAVYGLWLNAKGKVMADSFILRGAAPQEFYVISYFCPAVLILERLESNLIADDVTLTDETAEWWGYAVVDSPANPPPKASADLLVFPGRRGFQNQVEWLSRGPKEFPGARLLAVAEMERARLDAGIPAVPMDLGPGELPNEGGLEVEAVSYTKGCYLGQEVMARLKSMGQVRRQLLRVTGAGPIPALPAPLYQGGKKIGELRSAIALTGQEFRGLALISLLNLDRSAGFSLAPAEAARVQLAEKFTSQ